MQALPSPLTSNIPVGRKVSCFVTPFCHYTTDLIEVPQHPYIHHKLSEPSQKRKRAQEAGHPSPQIGNQPPSKRLRTSPSSCIAEENLHQEVASDISKSSTDPLQYWIQNGRWHREYFEQDSQVREDFEKGKSPEELDQKGWLQEHCFKEPFRPMHSLHHLFARKKSSSSLRRKSSESNLQTPSDQLPREVKSAPYKNPDYEVGLAAKGSFMSKSTLGVTDANRSLCRNLLEKEQTVPQDTLFRDDLFDETCESVQGRNEAMIIRDISPLICPSTQVLRIHRAKHLNHLYECVNEGWNSAIPFHGTRPQPDYSVGFGRSAFTDDQLKKLEPFVGDILYGSKFTTFFMATSRMYFPFLTCEVKCGAAALDVADRQNAHSMTVAVRGMVELYKAVKREKELHREILAFSISHDHSSVRIYGHYPVFEGDKTTFYRHPIHKFDFTALDGLMRWTAYKLTKNVLDDYSPVLHKRICSAIDKLPANIDFDLSQSASFSQSGLESSQQSNVESTFTPDEDGSIVGSQEITPTTSFAQTTASIEEAKESASYGAAPLKRRKGKFQQS